jgi:hypothetical protein
MTKEKKDETGGGKFRLPDFRSQIIILGILISAVGGIYWLFPQFWDVYWLPVVLIAAGLAIPPLFSLWKFWAGYGWQVGIAPGLAFILMGIFIWFFGYETAELWKNAVLNLILTNSTILAVWLLLLFAAFRSRKGTTQQQMKQDGERNQTGAQQDYRKGEIWRDYRWIIAPAIIILLFLFDTSWAQSMLSTSSLKKSVFKSTPKDTPQFHMEYPSQILFDDAEPSEIQIWADGLGNCGEEVEISGTELLFAVKPSPDSPIIWREKLTFKFAKNANAVTLLAQPSKPPDSNSLSTQINLESNGRIFDTSDWLIRVESRRDAQIRGWKKNFLDTGGTIVSLITAVFVGIKQLEEEKKRQKMRQVEQAISKLETDAKEDLPKTLQEHWDLTADWNEWDIAIQDQFRKAYAYFIEQKLWDALATTTEVSEAIERLLQMSERIFEGEDAESIHILKQIPSSLRQDGKALLALVRDYPESITIAKRIARNYSKEIKDNILREFSSKYKEEIKKIADALDFLPEEYPLLESLFLRYNIIAPLEGKLKEWLNLHRLTRSPFGDANTPFTPLPESNESLLVDLTSTGFSFDRPLDKQVHFKFNDAWDLRTAVYRFCKTIPSAIASKAFLVIVPPFLMIDYEKEIALNIVLHALGEQWLNTIVNEPTAYYDLNVHQQKMLARLLCWHYGSSHSVLARLSKEIDNTLTSSERQRPNQEERKEKNAREFLKKAPNWLGGAPSTPLYDEETPYLVDLRPSSTHRTFLLMPSVDLDYRSGISVSPEKYDVFDKIVDRLNIHNYTFAHFYLTDRRWRRVEEDALTRIVNERINQCVIQEDNPADQINSLNDLFSQHEKEEAEKILAQKADGSPGRMVRLGQKLLLQHMERYPAGEPLHIEDLIALE